MKKTVGVNVEVLHKGVSIDKDRVAPYFFPIRESQAPVIPPPPTSLCDVKSLYVSPHLSFNSFLIEIQSVNVVENSLRYRVGFNGYPSMRNIDYDTQQLYGPSTQTTSGVIFFKIGFTLSDSFELFHSDIVAVNVTSGMNWSDVGFKTLVLPEHFDLSTGTTICAALEEYDFCADVLWDQPYTRIYINNILQDQPQTCYQYGSLGNCDPIDTAVEFGYVSFYTDDFSIKITRILNEEIGLFLTIGNLKLGVFDESEEGNYFLTEELGPLVDDVDIEISIGDGESAPTYVQFDQVNVSGLSGFFVKPIQRFEVPPPSINYPTSFDISASSCQVDFGTNIILKFDNDGIDEFISLSRVVSILQEIELDPSYVRVIGAYFENSFYISLITSEFTSYNPITLIDETGSGTVPIYGLQFDIEISGTFTNSSGQPVPFSESVSDTTSIGINISDYTDVDVDAPFQFSVIFTTKTNHPTSISASVSVSSYSELSAFF